MKHNLLYILFFLTTTSAISQTDQKGTQDFQIKFESKAGREVVIKVLDNSRFSIPTAIVVIGDKMTIEQELKNCDDWIHFQNRTYIIDEETLNKTNLQETIDHILNSQKLLDANLYLIQLNNEFEQIKTKPGNIKGGKIIQRKNNMCETLKEITGAKKL